MFYILFVCGHYFFNNGLSKSVFSTYYFRELVFCLSVFYGFFRVMNFEFNVIFTFTPYGVKKGPGPWDHGPLDSGTRYPGSHSKFKSGTRDLTKV